MYFVDNGSAVPVMPQVKPVSSITPQFFTEGGNGVPPTWPGPDWFNIFQNELLNVLAAAGINPDKTDHAQLVAAMKKLFLSRTNPGADIKADGAAAIAAFLSNLGLSDIKLAGVCTGVLSTPGQISIPLIIGGVQKKCLIQWGIVNAARQSTTNVTLPVTYGNVCLFTLAVKGSAIDLTGEFGVGCSPVNNSTIAISNSNVGSGSTQGVRWLTIGY